MKIIDPHIHLFNLEQGDYHWLKTSNSPFWPDKYLINRSFKESELILASSIELSGFIHLEAGFDNNKPWQELEMLEQTCNKPFRAIANIDLTVSSKEFTKNIERLTSLHSFIGVRHIIDEQALRLLTNEQVLKNFTILNDFARSSSQGVIFETQLALSEHSLINVLCEVISANPDISFIINHAGFPPIDIQTIEWQNWQNNLRKLSMFPHVAIKCSGWEMTDRNYQSAWVNENLAFIFKTFGAKRMMLASNFPLCLLSKNSYQDYWQSVITCEFFQILSNQDKNALCFDNALRWYFINL